MKSVVLSTILTCVNFFSVQSEDCRNSSISNATDSTRRILFGERASGRDFPYLVEVLGPSLKAGGAIIREQWVLTAAHVLYDKDCTSIEVAPAVLDTKYSILIAECYLHPKYTCTGCLPRGYKRGYDIGLMKTATNIFDFEGVKIIPLPLPGTAFPPGIKAIVAGWGRKEYDERTKDLYWTYLLVEEWKYCNDKQREMICESDPRCSLDDIPEGMLCTRGEGPTPASTCFGDSGSPVVINDVVAGIAALTVPKGNSCRIGSPSMHTNVVEHLRWIYSYIDPDMDTSQMPEYIEE